jgi:glycosyltransferase involved in cell wall biosynthesis
MRHARLVLYPTSAEGFGLVPFEAARFGTPTVGIRFAPLDEFNGPPVWASGWTDLEIASAAGRLMESPDASADQVRATLQHADRYRWADTAAGLVAAYRSALSVPARRLTRG